MSDKCKSCIKTLSARQSKIQCSDCALFFHGSCVKLTKEDVDYYSANDEIWRCETCSKSRRKSMQVESSLEKKDVSIENVIELLQEMREESKKQIKDLETDLGRSVELCHVDISELTKKIDFQSEVIKKYEQSFEKVTLENKILSKKVNELESRVDELEQYSRSNSLEINGIPESSTESVIEIVKTVSSKLGVQIDNKDIDACHRLGVKKNDEEIKHRGIVVRFTTRVIKEDVLQKRRVKRNFNTKDIGFSDRPAEVVYINESLSSARRQVLNAARKLKRDKLVAFVWVRNGKILVRVEQDSKVVVMKSISDVEALQNSITTSSA